MKKIDNCIVENCIPSPTSCSEWNGGEIEYLGICNGDSLNNLLWELIQKVQDIAGEDISTFDIDGLLEICNQKAPLETTLISILTLVKNNQICLKDYIDTLNDKLNELFSESGVDVNLKCYSDFDNLGNQLSITRAELDQLIIDNLCSHKDRLDGIEGKLVVLQSQIDNIDSNPTVSELSISTCVDGVVRPTSSQVIKVAEELCELETSAGTPANISSALSKTPADFNSKFGLITGWDLTPANWAENYGNLLLAFNNLLARVENIEQNCCAVTCEDLKLGFTAALNDTGDGVIIRFTFGAGTVIPSGMVDKGSTGTIKDKNGVIETFTLAIANNYEVEVPISSLDKSGELTINISAKMGNDLLMCEKCLNKVISVSATCGCEITNISTQGTITIIYDETIN